MSLLDVIALSAHKRRSNLQFNAPGLTLNPSVLASHSVHNWLLYCKKISQEISLQTFKEKKMFKQIIFRVLAALVLLAAIAGLAGFAFNAGMARGAVLNLQAPAAVAGQALPYYSYGMPFMHRPFGFGILGILAPLFLLFLAFGAFRRMLWGPRFGGHHGMHMMHGPCAEKGPGSPDFVPPMFAEWHRRAHDQKDQPADPTAQK
jgi:hypothetical protein